jgi:hypothetical protein
MKATEALKQANCELDFSSGRIDAQADMLIPVLLSINDTGVEYFNEVEGRNHLILTKPIFKGSQPAENQSI